MAKYSVRISKVFTGILYALIAVFLAVNFAQLFNATDRQWDFEIYYQAARAHAQGQNPYDAAVIAQWAGKPIAMHYVYSPLTLGLFRGFALLSLKHAMQLYATLKFLALCGLLFIWQRYFLPKDVYRPLFLISAIYVYQMTIFKDFLAGNISLFEQLLLWLGLLALRKQKPWFFVAAVILASFFKLIPLLWLGILLFEKGSGRFWQVLAGGLSFGLTVAVSAFYQPTLWHNFFAAAAAFDSYGWSVTGLILDRIAPALGVHVPSVGVTLALGLILAVVFFGIYRRYPGSDRISLFLLSYALWVPRLKDYSYILLIVPTFLVFNRIKLGAVKWVFLIAACALPGYYAAVYISLLAYGCLIVAECDDQGRFFLPSSVAPQP